MEILYNFNKADINVKEKIGLAIPVFKRPEYLRACFDSLKKIDLKNAVVCIIDESINFGILFAGVVAPFFGLFRPSVYHRLTTGRC